MNNQTTDVTQIGSAKDNYLMKKITICNDINKQFSKSKTDIGISISSEKVDRLQTEKLKKMLSERENEYKKYIDDVDNKVIKRNNLPYKGIIKNYNYDREIKETDITIYKVNATDKDASTFANKKKTYDEVKQKEDTDIKNEYSETKKSSHEKKFIHEHKHKYCAKIDSGNDNIRVDRIEFYKKEQAKQDENKKKIDNIISSLIDTGAISSNAESINYDKIDTDSLEKTLKATFGEEEYKKMMLEMMKENAK